jgi:tripartite-type tricarboxylate transporter receptor subunit TctC
VAVAASAADNDFPTKPIKLLVGYAPASGADVVARQVAAKLQESLKQPVVVENKPGAGGVIATQEVVRSTPDGYTLLLAAMPQIAILPIIEKVPYNVSKDLVPVSQVVVTELVLVTNPQKVPSATMADFVAWAKKQPSLFMGTPGPGTVGHFGASILGDAIKVKVEPVHFRTTGDQMSALLNGDIQAQFFSFPAAAAQVQAGKLKALLVTGPARSATFPDTPTSVEAGYPTLQFASWYGVLAPAGTPTAVLDKLNGEIAKLSRAADTRTKFEEQGMRVTGSSRDDFAKVIQGDVTRWGEVVKSSGFKSQPQ